MMPFTIISLTFILFSSVKRRRKTKMQTIIVNLKSLYPEYYKEDILIEVTTDILEIIDRFEHMESAYDRK